MSIEESKPITMNRRSEANRITLIGSFVNTVLTIVKILAGIWGHSGAMIADGVHSLSDLLTDVVVLVGMKLTEKPEDEDHNYGHGKYETMATLIISAFLFIVGFEILKTGLENIWKVIQGETLPKPGMIALGAATLSILAKEILYHYTVRVGKKIKSQSIIANGWHHRSDALSSLGTFLGIGGAILLGNKWTVLDPVASVIVSIFIFKVGKDILMPAVNELMETSLQEEEKQKIIDLLESDNDTHLYHELRTRRLGNRAVIEFHILLEDTLSIKNAHDIATRIENQLKNEFGEDSIITIHMEPYHEETQNGHGIEQ